MLRTPCLLSAIRLPSFLSSSKYYGDCNGYWYVDYYYKYVCEEYEEHGIRVASPLLLSSMYYILSFLGVLYALG